VVDILLGAGAAKDVFKLVKAGIFALIKREGGEATGDVIKALLRDILYGDAKTVAARIGRLPITQQVALIAQAEAARGMAALSSKLTAKEWAAYQEAVWAGGSGGLQVGKAVERATRDRLEQLYPGRFDFNPSNGPDFYDRYTRKYTELTTPGQVAAKERKYQGYYFGKRGNGPVEVSTYVLPAPYRG
jgi:hypothetical protein